MRCCLYEVNMRGINMYSREITECFVSNVCVYSRGAFNKGAFILKISKKKGLIEVIAFFELRF